MFAFNNLVDRTAKFECLMMNFCRNSRWGNTLVRQLLNNHLIEPLALNQTILTRRVEESWKQILEQSRGYQ